MTRRDRDVPPGLSPPEGLALQAFSPGSFCSVTSSHSGMGEAGAVVEHSCKYSPEQLGGQLPWQPLGFFAVPCHPW